MILYHQIVMEKQMQMGKADADLQDHVQKRINQRVSSGQPAGFIERFPQQKQLKLCRTKVIIPVSSFSTKVITGAAFFSTPAHIFHTHPLTTKQGTFALLASSYCPTQNHTKSSKQIPFLMQKN